MRPEERPHPQPLPLQGEGGENGSHLRTVSLQGEGRLRQRPWYQTFIYAFEGLGYAWRTQPNMWVHTAISLAVVAVGLWVGLPLRDWAALVIMMGVVIAAELMNTAVEATVDLASPDLHPLAKIAKDTAAGAVLWLALAAVVVGALILGPPLWDKLAHWRP